MTDPGRPYAIRPYRPGDLEQILPLENESFPDPFDRDTFLQLSSAEPGGFLVAEGGDRILGYISVVARRGEGWVWSFAVEPGSRRKGIGSALMSAGLAYLSGKVGRVYLQVSVNNPAAIAMYERFSFVRKRRVSKYYPNGDDAFLMSLELKRR